MTGLHEISDISLPYTCFTAYFFRKLNEQYNIFYVLKYGLAYVTFPAIGRTGEHIGKATLSSADRILIESKWTVCKNFVAGSTTFKKTSNFLRTFYSHNLVPHLLQVLVLNHKQALSLNQLDGQDLHDARLSTYRRRTIDEENPTL